MSVFQASGSGANFLDALPPLILERIAVFLLADTCSSNDVASSLRLASKTLWRALQREEHRIIHLARPFHPAVFAALCTAPSGQAALTGMSLERRQQLLALVAGSGNVQNLQVAIAGAGCLPDDKAATAAAAGGHMGTCRWLLAQPGLLQPAAMQAMMRAAAEHGHEALLRWLADPAGGGGGAAHLVDTGVLAAAVRGGHARLADQLIAELRTMPKQRSVMRGHEQPLPADPAEAAAAAQQAVRERSRHARLMATARYRPAAELEALWAAEMAGAQPVHLRREVLNAAAGSRLPDWQDKVAFLERQGFEREVWSLQAALAEGVAEGDDEAAAARLAWLRARGGYMDHHGGPAAGQLAAPPPLDVWEQQPAEDQDQAAVDGAGGDGHRLEYEYDVLCGAAVLGGHAALLRSLLAEAATVGVDPLRPLLEAAATLAQLEWQMGADEAHGDPRHWVAWKMDPETGEPRQVEEVMEAERQEHQRTMAEKELEGQDPREAWDEGDWYNGDGQFEVDRFVQVGLLDFFFCSVDSAARKGYLGVLQVIHDAQPAWSGLPFALRAAAAAGHLHVLQWGLGTEQCAALGHGWGWRLLAAAACSGNVPLMSLLRERGCYWDAMTFVAALKSGNAEAVMWLQQHGCPLPRSDMPCWRAAIANCDVCTLRLLQHRLGRACRGLLPPQAPAPPTQRLPRTAGAGRLTPAQEWLQHQPPLVRQLAEAWYRRVAGGGAAGSAAGSAGGGAGGGADGLGARAGSAAGAGVGTRQAAAVAAVDVEAGGAVAMEVAAGGPGGGAAAADVQLMGLLVGGV
ncbi:hypothetical protein HYH02_008279 [Chlamydomonas schloesseri]|uniref:Uncharacterized protein n=1 Tax=Chlamydomonas schloesseri TaxID=2026947 RepID=A0A835WFQ3_9CHLO|nr:hypothetical protein HYH02_008279 [Chlamydomonas schloesseri]|eukprot:KAG2446714.1 hypothetical protein HYH02_008279 [Chlamydomonas schloesseri]